MYITTGILYAIAYILIITGVWSISDTVNKIKDKIEEFIDTFKKNLNNK